MNNLWVNVMFFGWHLQVGWDRPWVGLSWNGVHSFDDWPDGRIVVYQFFNYNRKFKD